MKLPYFSHAFSLLSLTLFLFTADAHAQQLVGAWSLDETVGTTTADSSGNGNNATFNSGTPNWTSGLVGNSVDFPSGASNFFNTATLDELGGGTGITVSGWLNSDDTSGFDGILTTRNASTSIGGSIGNWGLNREGDSFDVRVQTNATGGSSGLNTAAGTVATDRWIHVAMTWNGSDGARDVYI